MKIEIISGIYGIKKGFQVLFSETNAQKFNKEVRKVFQEYYEKGWLNYADGDDIFDIHIEAGERAGLSSEELYELNHKTKFAEIEWEYAQKVGHQFILDITEDGDLDFRPLKGGEK
jgi:hypothetical protein